MRKDLMKEYIQADEKGAYLVEGYMTICDQQQKVNTILYSYFMANAMKQQYELLGFEDVTIKIIENIKLPTFLKRPAF